MKTATATKLTKKCTKCGEVRDVEEFGVYKGVRWRCWCRGCERKYDREYYQIHKEERNEYQRQYRKSNPMCRLSNNIAWLMNQDLKARGSSKNGRYWATLVDFTLQDLKEYLESLFQPGMTWDNYGRGEGKWQVDHIEPRSGFNFTSSEDEGFKKCWALTNLQPLWWEDNLKKGSKVKKP